MLTLHWSASHSDSVTNIGDYAFENCTSLTNAVIGNGVVAIGISAFDTCSSLAGVVIPDSVTSIGDYAFEACTSLTNMILGSGVLGLGDGVLDDCISLTAITVAASNVVYSSVEGVLFDKSQSSLLLCPAGLAGNFTIPDGVSSIGDLAFYDCAGLGPAFLFLPASSVWEIKCSATASALPR